MSISSIGSAQAHAAGQVHGEQRHHSARTAGMDAAAGALSMSSQDLRSALASGASLASLAQAKGVSTDSLTATVSQAMKAVNPSMSEARADLVAQRLVTGPGGAVGGAGDRDHDGDSS